MMRSGLLEIADRFSGIAAGGEGVAKKPKRLVVILPLRQSILSQLKSG